MLESAIYVGELLSRKNLTVSVAESCTGGLICSLLTDVPGSSGYVAGGVVSYTNFIKNKVLNVPQDILDQYSAISSETALAMAEGVKKIMNTDYGVAVTGNVGPAPSEGKPVGLVYIAVTTPVSTLCKKFYFNDTRAENKCAVANTAIKFLTECIEEEV